MDNIIDFSEAKKNRLINTQNKPITTISNYLNYRNAVIEQIEMTNKIVSNFEKDELVYSDVCMMPRHKLDIYVSTKLSMILTNDLLRQSDEKIKKEYSNIDLSDLKTYTF
jgi:hypothetical protein